FFCERRETQLGQAVANKLFVRDHGSGALALVQQREFAEHRAGGKGGEPDIAARLLDEDARRSLGDQKHLVAGLAFMKDGLSGGVSFPPEPLRKRGDFAWRKARE